MTEWHEQAAFFGWLEWYKNQHPEAGLCFAIPNGQYRPGQRPEAGMKAGVPDIFCPIARGGYHGFFCEAKHGRNRETPEQLAWIEALRQQGFYVCVAYEFNGMQEEFEAYMNLTGA